MSTEKSPLVTDAQASMVASGTASLINASADKIKNAKKDGPLTFRTLGFIGGLAMIVSNGLGIIDRFFSFNFTGSMIAIYGVVFGVLSKYCALPAVVENGFLWNPFEDCHPRHNRLTCSLPSLSLFH